MTEAHEVLRLVWVQALQLTLLIAAIALAVRVTARRRPYLAHALWLVVLIKSVTPPLWSSPGGVFCWVETALPSWERSARSTVDPYLPQIGSDLNTHNPAHAESPDIVVPLHRVSGQTVGSERDIKALPLSPGDGSRSLASWFLIAWLTGTGLTLAVATWRWLRCLRQLRRTRIPHDAAYDAAMARLRSRLQLRRAVRLMVTTSRFGPAVIGLLRPVIVLPEIIVQGKTPAELEPILAHELIHVRRGDLWVGMLQTLAMGLWWFHPLVWLTNRWMAREAERCCDEAVLATLRCDPSRYARCLLDVLERKQMLRPVPACRCC
ncbi:MAG: M56 family metallopeptidase [Planctomycetes bacterium]|nr:M56 family metallopeptidase [Planctomycetota bacterium]